MDGYSPQNFASSRAIAGVINRNASKLFQINDTFLAEHEGLVAQMMQAQARKENKDLGRVVGLPRTESLEKPEMKKRRLLNKMGSTFHTVSYWAESVGLSKGLVNNYMRQLMKEGLIEQAKCREGRGKLVSVYRKAAK